MLIDTHCHPQFPQYDADREEIIRRALDNNIRMICVGTDLEKSKEAIDLAQKYDLIWASVGLHPNDVIYDLRITNYEELIKLEKVVAIGEIGLDYYRTKELEKQKLQKEVLKKFLELAAKLNKPVIIHCRDAHNDMISILKSYILSLKSVGVIHSFTGTREEAKKYIDLGFYIGFNGIITFARQYDEVVINIPLDRILVETDAPYLTPEPYRGKRSEPSYVKFVAEKIAELRKISIEEVAEQTTQNTKTLFKL